MGKIADFQKKVNNQTIQRNKPKLDTKGIKKLRLLKPGIEKEYGLTPSQKKYARNLRKTRNVPCYCNISWNTFSWSNCI